MNLDRMLVDKIENRILVGLVCFVGIMVIIGWVSINETGRMAAFADQFAGRSVERGGYLFSQNCSTCHGADGYGISGRAPGLNSPHLFGYDLLAAERDAIDSVDREMEPLRLVIDEYEGLQEGINSGDFVTDREALIVEQDELLAEQGGEISNARDLEITNRLNEIETEIADIDNAPARIVELEADYDAAAERMAVLEGEMEEAQAAFDARLPEIQIAIDNGYDPMVPDRLDQGGWGGSLRSYVYTTLVHGRPGSANWWPGGGGMAAWSQEAGGPLRNDQLGDLTSYILSWETDWTVDDFNAVDAYGIVPGRVVAGDAPAREVADICMETAGVDVDDIVEAMASCEGDATIGVGVYENVYACNGCHGNAAVAPPTEQKWVAAINGAGGRPYAGDPVYYLTESIVQPGAYIVNGYPAGAMPGNYGDSMTVQDLADILAYVETYAESE